MKFRPFFTFVLIGLVLTQLPGPPLLHADEAASDDVSTTTQADVSCVEAIGETVTTNTETFIVFLDEHFQSQKQNSELLDVAVEKYRAYRDTLNTLLATYASQFSEQDVIAQADAIFTCQNFVSDKLDQAKKVLIMHNQSLASGKRTFALVDAYKKLNDQLRNLNLAVGTLTSLFQKLNSNISCYPQECVR